jgi:rhodanese-related sulfurtransferase
MSPYKIIQILAVSAVLAAYSAQVRHGVNSDDVAEESPENTVDLTNAGASGGCKIRLLTLAETKALWRKASTVFLDVRSTPDFAYGHVRRAVSLPWEDFDDRFPAIKVRLQKAKAIVVYCKSVDCGKSLWASIRLRNEGLSQVLIYPNGWYEWTEHGLPVERDSTR